MNLSEHLITGKGLTVSEALGKGLEVTGLGLLIVFAVLVILMIVLCLFKVIFYKEKQKKAEVKVQSPVSEVKTNVAVEQEQDDSELVAIFAAAISCMSGIPTTNLKIKSYKRVDKSNWKRNI